MAAQKFNYWQRTIWLLPIPLLWIVLWHFGLLRTLDHLSMDWRFLVRGPLEAPVKLFYINRDETTTRNFKHDPFPREYYAKTAQAVLELGQARAIFFDFVMSPMALSEAVNLRFLVEQDKAMARVVRKFPRRIVLAGAYTDVVLPFADIGSVLRLKYLGDQPSPDNPRPYDPTRNPYPESPTYPIFSPGFAVGDTLNPGWGRLGLINVDVNRSLGATPRWVPLFVELDNEFHAANYAFGRTLWAKYQKMLAGEAPEAVRSDATSDPDHLLVWDGERLLERIPRRLPFTVHTVALELLAAGHDLDSGSILLERAGGRPHGRWEVVLKDLFADQVLCRVPCVDEQMLEINWFSPWLSLQRVETALISAVERVIALRWEVLREPASLTGDARQRLLEDLVILRNAPVDPYNPMASMALVVSLYDLHQAADPEVQAAIQLWFKRLEGALVLCGPTDPILQDIAPTPFDHANVPRVSVHGNVLKTMVSGRFLQRPPAWATPVLILLLTIFISHLFMNTGRRSRMLKVAAFGLLLGYILIVFNVFTYYDVVLPLIEPVASSLTTAMLGLLIQLTIEQRAKSRIKGMFGTYVSPDLVNRMIESGEEPTLGGQQSTITAFFSDVQNFSTFSEKLTPPRLVDLMNEYLNAMTLILEEEGGTLDKYIGDAIVAMFGAPVPLQDHALRAAITTQRMHRRLAELRRKWHLEGAQWPAVVPQMRMRIGLNTGPATVGNMGSVKRFNYTMMGDTVNLAARCESGAKSAGVYTLITRETREAAVGGDRLLLFRFTDKWRVKGRTAPADMFEILGFREDLPDSAARCVELYERGFQRYLARDWEGAAGLFRESFELEPLRPGRDPGVHHNPSEILLERCAAMQAHPPPDDWDGVYEMTTK